MRLHPINPWVKAFEVRISLFDPWVKAFEVQISLFDPWVKAFEVRISLFDPWVKAFEVQISLFDPWVKAFEVQISLFDPWVKAFAVQINLFDPQVTRGPARVTMPALPGRSGCTQGTLPNPATQPLPSGHGYLHNLQAAGLTLARVGLVDQDDSKALTNKPFLPRGALVSTPLRPLEPARRIPGQAQQLLWLVVF